VASKNWQRDERNNGSAQDPWPWREPASDTGGEGFLSGEKINGVTASGLSRGAPAKHRLVSVVGFHASCSAGGVSDWEIVLRQ